MANIDGQNKLKEHSLSIDSPPPTSLLSTHTKGSQNPLRREAIFPWLSDYLEVLTQRGKLLLSVRDLGTQVASVRNLGTQVT